MLIFIIQTLLTFALPYATQSYTRNQLKINELRQFNTTQCHLITLNPMMKKVRISLMEIYSLKSVIVTDSPLAFDCYAQNLIEDCTNRNMCMSFMDIKQNLQFSLGYCTDTVYIYIVPEKYTFYKASFIIHSRYLSSPCNSIPQTLFTKCGVLSSRQCGSKCTKGCVHVGCRPRDQEFQKFGLCLPDNLSNQQYLSRCMMDKNITTFSITNPCKNQKQNGTSFFHAVLVIVFLILTLILVAAIWYRYKFIQQGVAPFSPPGFAPEWMFPRVINPPENLTHQNINL